MRRRGLLPAAEVGPTALAAVAAQARSAADAVD
jgi:hypothetical protein